MFQKIRDAILSSTTANEAVEAISAIFGVSSVAVLNWPMFGQRVVLVSMRDGSVKTFDAVVASR
ncbi:hypothetical protein KJ766_03015 [Patescibacteria group bacterium]|nr:hypothetical protein [Patescibacteria group bacterium]